MRQTSGARKAGAAESRACPASNQGGRGTTRESHMDNGVSPSPVFPFSSTREEHRRIKSESQEVFFFGLCLQPSATRRDPLQSLPNLGDTEDADAPAGIFDSAHQRADDLLKRDQSQPMGTLRRVVATVKRQDKIGRCFLLSRRRTWQRPSEMNGRCTCSRCRRSADSARGA